MKALNLVRDALMVGVGCLMAALVPVALALIAWAIAMLILSRHG